MVHSLLMQTQQRAIPALLNLLMCKDPWFLNLWQTYKNAFKGLEYRLIQARDLLQDSAQNLLKYYSKSQSELCKQGCLIHIRHVSKVCFSLPSELAAFRALGVSCAQQSLKNTNYTDRGLHWRCAMTLVSKALCRGQWLTQATVKAHNDSSIYQLTSSPVPTLIPGTTHNLMMTQGRSLAYLGQE